ncbi:hypothetical protein OG943_29950 [Amycolatopsis sp. NBC_00345]
MGRVLAVLRASAAGSGAANGGLVVGSVARVLVAVMVPAVNR